jgi:hypothetical protein
MGIGSLARRLIQQLSGGTERTKEPEVRREDMMRERVRRKRRRRRRRRRKKDESQACKLIKRSQISRKKEETENINSFHDQCSFML